MNQPDQGSERGLPDARIEIVEETAEIKKVERVTGMVRVRRVTETADELLRDVLQKRNVHIERIAVGRVVETAPDIRVENGVTIMPIFEERLVVEKRLFLVEELHIHHETTFEDVEIPTTLRKQRAVVDRSAPGNDIPSNED